MLTWKYLLCIEKNMVKDSLDCSSLPNRLFGDLKIIHIFQIALFDVLLFQMRKNYR
jgi:hypothetical protein